MPHVTHSANSTLHIHRTPDTTHSTDTNIHLIIYNTFNIHTQYIIYNISNRNTHTIPYTILSPTYPHTSTLVPHQGDWHVDKCKAPHGINPKMTWNRQMIISPRARCLSTSVQPDVQSHSTTGPGQGQEHQDKAGLKEKHCLHRCYSHTTHSCTQDTCHTQPYTCSTEHMSVPT